MEQRKKNKISTEKIGTYITSAVSQVERGSYPYVQIKFSSTNNVYKVVTKGFTAGKIFLSFKSRSNIGMLRYKF